jgi:uncharacterized protein (DUF952 family)
VRKIFHFISESDLGKYMQGGHLQVPSLVNHGFIHCSLPEQVIHVANSIAPNRTDLLLVEIDEDRVTPKIVYENLEGGNSLFPHIYGPLNEDAIISIHPFIWKDGTYIMS